MSVRPHNGQSGIERISHLNPSLSDMLVRIAKKLLFAKEAPEEEKLVLRTLDLRTLGFMVSPCFLS